MIDPPSHGLCSIRAARRSHTPREHFDIAKCNPNATPVVAACACDQPGRSGLALHMISLSITRCAHASAGLPILYLASPGHDWVTAGTHTASLKAVVSKRRRRRSKPESRSKLTRCYCSEAQEDGSIRLLFVWPRRANRLCSATACPTLFYSSAGSGSLVTRRGREGFQGNAGRVCLTNGPPGEPHEHGQICAGSW
jgi:hypothetical protein